MNAMPETNPYTQTLPEGSQAYLQDVARRRWIAQREQESKRRRQRTAKAANRVTDIRRLRPGRAVANSLSPVYSMFSESFFRSR